MSDQKIRVIVAGCGRLVTQVHLPNLARMSGVEVVALVDPNSEAIAPAKAFAPRAATFAQLDEALKATPCDAVLVASPSGLHAQMAMSALDAGVCVYLEKPIATEEEDARRLASHQNAAKSVMVGFNYRFHPLIREMRQHIRSRVMGKVVSVRTMFSIAESSPPAWRRKRGTGGGALLDLLTHDIDLIRHVTGREIVSVSANILSRHHDDDTASLMLGLEGGIVAQCLAMDSSAETARFEVIGESGAASFERYRSNRLETIGRKVGGLSERLGAVAAETAAFPRRFARLHHPWNEPSFGLSLEAFIRAVRNKKGFKPGISDGMKSLEVLLAAEESSASGRRIELKAGSPQSETAHHGK